MRKCYLLIGLAIIISACGSDNTDEPTSPNQNSSLQESAMDWIVEYREDQWQNSRWGNNVNTSDDCLKWKEQHQENLIRHEDDEHDHNHKFWEWKVGYRSKVELEVVMFIEQFIKFTMPPNPNNFGKTGIDKFSASLYCKERDYKVEYYFDPTKASTPQNEWRITFAENSHVYNGENLPVPAAYKEWVEAHKQDMEYSSKSSSDYESWAHYKWSMSVSSFDRATIESEILPFIHWTQHSPTGRSSNIMTVDVKQLGTGITICYSYSGH